MTPLIQFTGALLCFSGRRIASIPISQLWLFLAFAVGQCEILHIILL